MKKFILAFVLLFITSCNNIEFVYNEDSNIINPIYGKTTVSVTGTDLVYVNSYIQVLFGSHKEKDYDLQIFIKEKKTKRSIETNQAASNIRYELRFFYTLKPNKKECILYEKEIVSYFTIIPKSAGYNYGTDSSLEKKYELAIIDNLNQFVSFLSSANMNNC